MKKKILGFKFEFCRRFFCILCPNHPFYLNNKSCLAWNFEHFGTPTQIRQKIFFDKFLILVLSLVYFGKFLFVSNNLFLFSRTFFLSLPFSVLTGLDCFRKVKWKMQFILCFLKSASKSLRSHSLNFPLKSCDCHQNLSIFCLQSQNFFSLLCNFFSLLCNFFSLLCNFFSLLCNLFHLL